MRRAITIAVGILALAMGGVAHAAVIDAHWLSVDGDPTVVGSVQNTLLGTMTKDWTNSRINVTLTAGKLLDPLSATNRRVFMGANENDTWVDSFNASEGFPSILAWPATATWNGPGLYGFAWADTGNNGPVVDGIGARIYASDAAQGTWEILMYDRDSAGVATRYYGNVTNGNFAVPEPGTLTMLGFGALSLVGMSVIRRNKRRTAK